jgi:hypothetical protein
MVGTTRGRERAIAAMRRWRKLWWISGAASEHRRRSLHDLLVGDVAHVLGQAPAVPEGIDDLALPVPPKGVLQRLVHLGPRRHRPPRPEEGTT